MTIVIKYLLRTIGFVIYIKQWQKDQKQIQQKRLKKVRDKNKKVVRVVEEIKKIGVRNLRGDKQKIENRLILKEEKIYIPKDEKLRAEIIQLYHNTPVTGHEGKWKMIELVMRNYQWPEVTKDIGKYVEEYDTYQRMKNRIETPVGKLIMNEVLEKP